MFLHVQYATTDWRYFIAGSKYDLYQAASGHPNFDLIRESEFYYFACFELVKVKMGAESTVINSFGGKAQIKLTNPEINDIGDFEIDIKPLPRSGVKKQRIHHYITLTDSDKYVVNYNCFNGKIRGFTVLSTEALLDVGKMKRIDEHVITLGFRREDIIWLRRDACGKAEENQHCTKEGPTCSGK